MTEVNIGQLLYHLIGYVEKVKALQLTLTGQKDLLSCSPLKFVIVITVALGAAGAI